MIRAREEQEDKKLQKADTEVVADLATSFFALANLHKRENRLDDAEKFFVKALEYTRECYPDGSFELVNRLHELAKFYRYNKDLNKAEFLCIEALEMRKRIALDKEKLHLVELINFLAKINVEKGNLKEAQKIFLEILNILDESDLNHEPAYSGYFEAVYLNFEYDYECLRAACRVELANVYLKNNDYELARSQCEQALQYLDDSMLWFKRCHKTLSKITESEK